ncbi:MAG: MarR family transcriptional regulator [Eubacteriales bacterium]|nr:MarR family transcriptional regulator [Eubacteriales bacterium]
MVEESFKKLYLQFRLNYLRQLPTAAEGGAGALSAAEFFCAEAAYLLERPTVSELAAFLNVSLPNANYKINSLVKKGYLKKEVCEFDKREYRLSVTPEFLKDYGLNSRWTRFTLRRIRERFTPEECETLDDMIRRISEFMEQAEKGEEKEQEHGD